MSDAPLPIRAVMSSVERRGPWTVPREVELRVVFGSLEIDLREAELGPGVTTFEVDVTMGHLELAVPPDLPVEIQVQAVGGNVSSEALQLATPADPARPRLRLVGKVKMGNCEVIALHAGETRATAARRARMERHARHHHRWHALHAEREMWRSSPDRSSWLPWWLQARMRRRIFSWFAIAFAAGIAVGVYAWDAPRWWYIALFALGLSVVSGAVAWKLTQPLILVVRAARDIGDGKLDTRLDTRYGGEMRVLGTAINEMAARIEQQLKDQRQLLAAVSHELRTPLGHMRVLIETARDADAAQTTRPLDELEREVLMLDDLVGRLLASSRLEFGNLERRDVDLGELVGDAVASAGVSLDTVEAVGDVHARVDPTLVRRAVANLLDNARVHGGGAVAVRVERRAGQIAIEVDDAGPGVPADRRADAFRAFVPSSGGGLGLGLALVSRIAVAHEGGAWIADRPGGGARVGFAVRA